MAPDVADVDGDGVALAEDEGVAESEDVAVELREADEPADVDQASPG